MENTMRVLLFIGLISILSCSNVSGRRPGKRDFCQLPAEVGRCRASWARWYYNSSSGECRNFSWGGCGGNFNRFESKSACELVCKPGCRHDSCSTTCAHGFILDAQGCNTCRCQPGPEETHCPAIECPTRCLHGYLRDSDDCATCDCRTEQAETRVNRRSPQHQCPPVCYMFCEYGNKEDENGCAICACNSKEEVCGSQQCMMECPTGFVTDHHGCELCKCKPAGEAEPDCPTNQCLKECSFGFQKDSFGCEICACASWRNRQRQTADCSKRPTCAMHCPSGFLKGRDGCDICRCARRNTDRRITRIERRFGKESSSEDVCGVSPMCTMYCPEGFQKDRRGCDICACRSVRAAQLPAGNVSASSAQKPANLPSQLPAQIPANIPAQQPDGTPSQIPADIPSQLPENIDCRSKKCHKYVRCSFGFAKDEFGCDTCVCSHSRSRTAPKRRS